MVFVLKLECLQDRALPQRKTALKQANVVPQHVSAFTWHKLKCKNTSTYTGTQLIGDLAALM